MIRVEVEELRVVLADGRSQPLRRQAALVLDAVVRAKGRCVTHEFLCDLLWPNAADQPLGARKSIHLAVLRARRAAGHDSIEAVWGMGYRLGPQSKEHA